jgi:phage shock protein PspC (stress-responsive transcriptional regulator)
MLSHIHWRSNERLNRSRFNAMPRRKSRFILKPWPVEFIPALLGGVALGLGLSWAKKYFNLNDEVIDLILIALAVIGLFVMGFFYYALYRAYLEDDE